MEIDHGGAGYVNADVAQVLQTETGAVFRGGPSARKISESEKGGGVLHPTRSTALRAGSSNAAEWAIITSTMTATAAQFAANRANATKSTGPRTSEGRAVSAMNGQRHGLRSDSAALLPSESPEAWSALLDGLRKEWKPVGITEELLVERMASAEWKRRRSEVFEKGGLVIEGAADDGPAMALMRDCHKTQTVALTLRYRRACDAAFFQAMHSLERQQARRNLPEGATMPPPLAIDVTVVGDASEPSEE